MAGKLLGTAIQSGTITSSQFSNELINSIGSGSGSDGPKIASLLYPSGNSASSSGGETITLNGSGFDSNVAVYLNGNAAPSTTFISSSNVQFTTPALVTNAYLVYAINPDGGFAIYAPGINVAVAFAATGGTVSNVGGYRIHTFTSSGSFEVVSGSAEVEYLVAAGGGGGGSNRGGGGGAGGLKTGTGLVVAVGNTYTITVGAGGGTATQGSNSSALGISTTGGGRGGSHTGSDNGGSGGSGGGAAMNYSTNSFTGGAGISGEGNNGGNSGVANDSIRNTGGGGGAGAAGTAGSGTTIKPDGGIGTASSITGSSVYYAGGGGGASGGTDRPNAGAGDGGLGGGGNGSSAGSATAGTTNTGGGGGGASTSSTGAAGGSGIVIIRYPI
jgi:hypothetical protein